ncbi:MAG: mechanosensitive ion channel family protein [Henriciella sp.]|nr:mechanosensitive ion channel family protein [Henriciella sp.]
MQTTGMDGLTTLPFNTSGWPTWLADWAPQGWLIIIGFGLFVSAFLIGYLAKRSVRFLARKAYTSDEQFLGSSWDLSAPVIQLLVFLLALTAGAELLGFDFGDRLVGYWPRALAGLIIISGAMMLATWINRSLRAYGQRAHARNKVDDTLISFSASIIRYVVLGIAILAAMTQFGFAPGSLIAIVGAAGLAIALALQDTLKAVAAGFMIAAFRPFRIGDWVQIGEHEGEVAEITPFTTAINQIDNKRVVLTNDKVWGDAIINYTRLPQRRLDLYFGVHYDTDLDHALDVVKQVANAHTRVQKTHETWVGVHSLDDWAITIRLRAWVPAREFVQVRADITKDMKQTFDKEGIEIPYPHQVEYVKEGLALKPMPSNSPSPQDD